MSKMDVGGLAIKFGARKKKAIKNKLEALLRKQFQVDVDRDKSVLGFEDHDQQLSLIAAEIESIIQGQAKYSALQNEVKWHMYGEKASKYFMALEKVRSKTPLTRLQINEYIIEDGDKILDELKGFYAKLFASAIESIDDEYFESTEIPKITEG